MPELVDLPCTCPHMGPPDHECPHHGECSFYGHPVDAQDPDLVCHCGLVRGE